MMISSIDDLAIDQEEVNWLFDVTLASTTVKERFR